MERHRVKILGTGTYLPGEPVEFDDILKVLGEVKGAPSGIVDWTRRVQPVMKQMLGIDRSYYAVDPQTGEFTETNVTMSVKAARKAMEAAGVGPEDIEFIAYGSQALENMPTTSVLIQDELGIQACGEMSIHSNCTSAYKAVMLAHDLVSLGRYRTVMVISSQMSSSQMRADFFNPKEVKRSHMLLRWFLSDGAACLILSRDDGTPKGGYLEASFIESLGCGVKPFMYNLRESFIMNPLEIYEKGFHHVTQEGIVNVQGEDSIALIGKTFVNGVKRMADQFQVDLGKTTYFQVNFPVRHIFELIKELCTGIGIPENSYYTKLYNLGYPGPPAGLIALDSIIREENPKPGDQIVSFVTEVSKVMQAGFVIRYY